MTAAATAARPSRYATLGMGQTAARSAGSLVAIRVGAGGRYSFVVKTDDHELRGLSDQTLTKTEDDELRVTVLDTMVQVFPWSKPVTPLTVPLAAARGELVHLQAVLKGKEKSDAVVTASCRTLVGTIRVRRVGYVNLTKTFSAGRPIGLYPTTLLPASYVDKVTASAEPPTVFWLTIRVPRNASAGSTAVRSMPLSMVSAAVPYLLCKSLDGSMGNPCCADAAHRCHV